LIAEPWGGGKHDMPLFSNMNVSSWNDLFRNGIKGADPHHAPGIAFGLWGNHSPEEFGLWILGSVQKKGGPFIDAGHSINYLESHDGYTLGDFIRIATGEVDAHGTIEDIKRYHTLTFRQQQVHALCAFLLMVSQGAVMIHSGQEFARGKIIAPSSLPGTISGHIDENSYEKDDETNWINYSFATQNNLLVDFYTELISIRKRYPALRHGLQQQYHFLSPGTSLASGFEIEWEEKGCVNRIAALVNPNPVENAEFTLSGSQWKVLVHGFQASVNALSEIHKDRIVVKAATAILLVSNG